MTRNIMSRLFFGATLSLAALSVQAQQLPDQTPNAVWHLENMQGNAVVVLFKSDSARIQKDNDVLTFAVRKEGTAIRLKNIKSDTEALRLLNVTPEAVNMEYGADPLDMAPTEKLLTAANRLPDRKLLLEGSTGSAAAPTVTDTPYADGYAEETPVTNTNSNLSNAQPWLYALGALILGFILGWLLKPRAKTTTAAAPMEETELPGAADPDEGLKQEISTLQQHLALGQKELGRLQQEDRQYFQALFEQLLLPLQESMEQNKKAHLAAQLVTATVLLSSLTRHKLGKKGKYDEANLSLLTGVAGASADAPLITAATPPDQIPHHLRALIEILKDQGVTGLGDLVVQGYRIKDL